MESAWNSFFTVIVTIKSLNCIYATYYLIAMRNALPTILILMLLLVVCPPLIGSVKAAIVNVVDNVYISVGEDGSVEVDIYVNGMYPDIDFGFDPSTPNLGSQGVAILVVSKTEPESNLIVSYNLSLPVDQLKSRADNVALELAEVFEGLQFTYVGHYSTGVSHSFTYTVSGDLSVAFGKFITCKPKQSFKKIVTSAFLKRCKDSEVMFHVSGTGVITLTLHAKLYGYFSGSGLHRLNFREFFGFNGMIPHAPHCMITITLPLSASFTNVECGDAQCEIGSYVALIEISGPMQVPNIIAEFTYEFPEADTIAPVISISSPSNGATVNGVVTISAEVSDESGIAWVAFFIDDNLLTNLTSPPWQCSWDTSTVSDGAHTITVEACDIHGNKDSTTIQVYVNNAGGESSPIPDILSGLPIDTWTIIVIGLVIIVVVIAVIAFVLAKKKSAKVGYTQYPPPPPPPPPPPSS